MFCHTRRLTGEFPSSRSRCPTLHARIDDGRLMCITAELTPSDTRKKDVRRNPLLVDLLSHPAVDRLVSTPHDLYVAKKPGYRWDTFERDMIALIEKHCAP